MKSVAVVVLVLAALVGGCNHVLGLEHLPEDARDDATIPFDDSLPPACAMTPIMFTRVPMTIPVVCDHYTTRADGANAIMWCNNKIYDSTTGTSNMNLQTLIPGIANPAAPRVGAKAVELYLTDRDAHVLTYYTHVAADSWGMRKDLWPTTNELDEISQPSGPTAGIRRALVYSAGTHSFQEMLFDGDMLTPIGMAFDQSVLGVTPLSGASLSPDGLRAVFLGQDGPTEPDVYLMSRLTLADQFSDRPAQAIYPHPGIEYSPHLSADCETLYFTDAETGIVDYVTR